MISINKILKDKNFINKISLLIFFCISWLSISSTLQNLLIFYSNETITINQLINFFRTTLNIGIFPILLFQLVKILIETNSLNSRLNLIFFISLAYFLSQSPALFYTSNSIENLYYVLSAINLLMIMRLSVEIFKPNELIILIYITFFILLLVLINSFGTDVIKFIYSDDTVKRFYGNINTLMGENYVRSSGASRISLILLVFYTINLKKHINSNILKILPLFIFSTIIFLYESRAVVGLLFLYVVFSSLILEKFEYKNFFKNIVFCIVLPFFISLQINYIHSPAAIKSFKLKSIEKLENPESKIELEDSALPELKDGFLCKLVRCDNYTSRYINKQQMISSSGRIDDWKKLITKFDYKNNLIFGYGSQGDRHLINQTASNALLYSLVSSGIMGLLFFIVFSSIASFYVLEFIFKNKNKNSISSFSILTLMIVMVRSLIESSYAVFGIDFILFNMCLFLSHKHRNSIK
jgi:hypothetical protein